jgi:hypothetical protein
MSQHCLGAPLKLCQLTLVCPAQMDAAGHVGAPGFCMGAHMHYTLFSLLPGGISDQAGLCVRSGSKPWASLCVWVWQWLYWLQNLHTLFAWASWRQYLSSKAHCVSLHV